MRRRYSRDLAGVDVAVWGIPLDAAVTNRPGARFGPQAIRRASAILCGDPQYPFNRDPFEKLTVVDYGDCAFDYGRHAEIPGAIEAQARAIIDRGVHLISLGGDHFVTWPLLQAHAAGTVHWRWCSSTRIRTPGTTTATGSTTAPSSAARCAPG